jgi:hypothetical protein
MGDDDGKSSTVASSISSGEEKADSNGGAETLEVESIDMRNLYKRSNEAIIYLRCKRKFVNRETSVYWLFVYEIISLFENLFCIAFSFSATYDI